jgi:hypothetical protein
MHRNALVARFVMTIALQAAVSGCATLPSGGWVHDAENGERWALYVFEDARKRDRASRNSGTLPWRRRHDRFIRRPDPRPSIQVRLATLTVRPYRTFRVRFRMKSTNTFCSRSRRLEK